MAGSWITAAVFACIIGCAFYLRAFPPEMSEAHLKKFRRALLFTTLSVFLLSVIWEIAIFGDGWGFGSHRAFMFWLILSELIVNGVALFGLLRPLMSLLPFSSGDASEISAIGMAFALVLGLVEVLLSFIGLGLMFGE